MSDERQGAGDDARGPKNPWTEGMDATVPALCERCWFPILPGQTARRTPVHVTGPSFAARLVSFVHCAPPCDAQVGDEAGDEDEAGTERPEAA